ncbi:hypothetical protein X798_00857 [Onchocerca flexuosa]|uniref:Uncharacterized protein n=2 Tax=Onchocerca flexuosa TaxID=387005 RepID=A0A183HV24_9BILA|nr:hypothetical protein X798_00857 [Onchocerca flexuosa]VDO75721.1 unnamed protein product [Onchocerca flexuosa]
MIKFGFKWIKLKWHQYHYHLSYWNMAMLSTINDQLLSFINISDMVNEILLSTSRIYYHFSSSILHLLFFNTILKMILLPYAYGKTNIPIVNAINNSGNAVSDMDSLLPSETDNIFHLHEPIKNIIGENRISDVKLI